MKREKTKRFMYILSNYANTMRKDQCLTQLLKLDTASVEDVTKHYFIQLKKTKELVFIPSKVSTKQADTMTAKSPVFKLISLWFYEFESDSTIKLTEYALKMYCSSFDNVSIKFNECKHVTHKLLFCRSKTYLIFHC
jgi:hypothetical protein